MTDDTDSDSDGESGGESGPESVSQTDAASDAESAEKDRPALADERGVDAVYEPAEDSRLLAATAGKRVHSGERALDVGTGSGFVAAALAEAGADVVASDLNPSACRKASERGVPAVRGDLLSPFVADSFDLVTFNPPYLPTPEDREWDDWMEHALSGGEDGRRLVDPFLEDLARVLAPEGRAFLLISSLTGIDEVMIYADGLGLSGELIAQEKHPYERLVVIRLTAD